MWYIDAKRGVMLEKILCRTPNGGQGVRIPAWKFNAVSAAIKRAVGPDGLAFSALIETVRSEMPADELSRLGSLSWHVMAVKLELEMRGELIRKGSPQMLWQAGQNI